MSAVARACDVCRKQKLRCLGGDAVQQRPCDRCAKLGKACSWPALNSRRAGRPRPLRTSAQGRQSVSEMLQDGHAIEASDLEGLLNAPDANFDSMTDLLNTSLGAQPSDGSLAFSSGTTATSSPSPIASRAYASDPLIDVFFERCQHFVPFMPQRRVFDQMAIAQSPTVRAAMSLMASPFVSNGLAAAQAYRQTAMNGIYAQQPSPDNILERLTTLLLITWFDYGDNKPASSRDALQMAVAQLLQSGVLQHAANLNRTDSAVDDMLLRTIHEIWATDIILQVTNGDRLSVLGTQIKLAAPLPKEYSVGRNGEAPVQLYRLRALAILHFASGNESSPFHELTMTGLALDQPSASLQGIETTIDNTLPVVQGALGRLVSLLQIEQDAEAQAVVRKDAESAFMATLMLLASKIFLVQRRTTLLSPEEPEKCSTPAELDAVFAPLDANAPDAIRPALQILDTIRDDLTRHGTSIPFHAPFFGCAHIISSHAIVKYLCHIGPSLSAGNTTFKHDPSPLQLSSSFDLLEESARRQSVTWPCASQSMKRLVAYRIASSSFCDMIEFRDHNQSWFG